MDRVWTVEADSTGTVDPSLLAEEMVKAGVILEKIGGGLVVAPHRFEDEDGNWHTDRVIFKWDSFVPGTRRAAPAVERTPAPEPEPEPEPELVGTLDEAVAEVLG